MHACALAERGERIYPKILLAGLRSPSFATLLKLGTIYPLAAALAISASSIIDDGMFWKIISGQIALDPQSSQAPDMPLAMLFATVLYLLAPTLLWFAAPLIAWQKMSLGKAIFYSFFSVIRYGKAFLMYLAVSALCFFLSAFTSVFLATLFNNAGIAMLIMPPLVLLLIVVIYCSFYPTYTHLFGAPEIDLDLPE